MNGNDMADGRIGIERRAHLIAARRHVIALVDQAIGAAQIPHGFRRAKPVGPVGQYQHLAIPGNEGAEQRLDAIGSRPLHRYADKFAPGVAGKRDKLIAKRFRHGAKVTIPRPPITKHGLLDFKCGGQGAGGQQIGLAQRRCLKRSIVGRGRR